MIIVAHVVSVSTNSGGGVEWPSPRSILDGLILDVVHFTCTTVGPESD